MGLITEALDRHPIPGEGRWGESCEGSEYHSPRPLLVRTFTVAGTVVRLCGTCEDNVRVFLSLMTASTGTLPWSVRREFGNRVRALGMSAWESGESDLV